MNYMYIHAIESSCNHNPFLFHILPGVPSLCTPSKLNPGVARLQWKYGYIIIYRGSIVGCISQDSILRMVWRHRSLSKRGLPCALGSFGSRIPHLACEVPPCTQSNVHSSLAQQIKITFRDWLPVSTKLMRSFNTGVCKMPESSNWITTAWTVSDITPISCGKWIYITSHTMARSLFWN